MIFLIKAENRKSQIFIEINIVVKKICPTKVTYMKYTVTCFLDQLT